MQVTNPLSDNYTDIGGCDKQIRELAEAIVWPITHPEKYKKIGIQSPKGVLLYGPPGACPAPGNRLSAARVRSAGTGKTSMARIVAAQTKATFVRLAGTQLTQMHIGWL